MRPQKLMVDPITLLVLTHYQTFEEDPRTSSLVIHFCGEGASMAYWSKKRKEMHSFCPDMPIFNKKSPLTPLKLRTLVQRTVRFVIYYCFISKCCFFACCFLIMSLILYCSLLVLSPKFKIPRHM